MLNKKLAALLMSLAVILAIAVPSGYAAPKPASVLLDGTPVSLSSGQPFVEQSTTFVPMRPLFNALGIHVVWNSKLQTIVGTKDSLTITLTIGNTSAVVNSRTVHLSAAPRIVNNVTYVPLRFVSEATGYMVGWTASTNTITISSPPKKEPSKGFLWKVEHNGNTVYLLGSIHVANEAMYPLRPEIEEAFESADYLGVEIDITDVDQTYVDNFVKTESTYSDGTTLKDHITAATYEKLRAVLQAHKLPPNRLDNYKPWFIAQSLPKLLSPSTNYESDLGIDRYLLQKAHEVRKPIIALESIELQLNMLSGYSESLQETQLLEVINAYSINIPNQRNAGQEALANMWSTGNEQTLVGMVTAIAAQPEYYKSLLADRNNGMTDKIEGYLNSEEKQTYLIVVGALHMLGPDGIVTQLEKDGFTVEKL